MLELPLRRAYSTRDGFAAAVSDKFAELVEIYEAEPILFVRPEWTRDNVGRRVFHATLPIDVAKQGGDMFGLASIIKRMIEWRKIIVRIARVETSVSWSVWVEVE